MPMRVLLGEAEVVLAGGRLAELVESVEAPEPERREDLVHDVLVSASEVPGGRRAVHAADENHEAFGLMELRGADGVTVLLVEDLGDLDRQLGRGVEHRGDVHHRVVAKHDVGHDKPFFRIGKRTVYHFDI